MKFKVNQALQGTEDAFDVWLPKLRTELANAFTATQPAPLDITGVRILTKTLGEDNDEFGRLRQFLGNASGDLRTYLDFPTDVALANQVQVWDIFNTTADTHPMHFHLVNVEVLSRRAWAFNSADGTPVLPLTATGPELPVDENEKSGNCWRETVRMNPGEVTRVAMKFELPAGTPPPSPRLLNTYGIKASEYVWHCHILEHEEHDMMRPLVVLT